MSTLISTLLMLFLLAFLRIHCASAIFNIDIGSDIPQGEYEAPPSSAPTTQDERPYSSIDILTTPTGPNRGAGSGASDTTEQDCYKVFRNMLYNNEYYHPGCWTDRYFLEYYNGDLNEDYEDSGYPKETYLQVTVEIVRDCTSPQQQEDRCTISVAGLGECNQCSYNAELQTVTMENCRNLNRIFEDRTSEGNPQIMAVSPTVVCPTPTTCRTLPQYFPLSTTSINGVGGSLERCDHPLWFGDTYAPTPTPANHMKLKLDLTYAFRAGSGRQPTPAELNSIQHATQAFVKHSLNEDPMFGTGEVVDDVHLHIMTDQYSTDELVLEMDLAIVLEDETQNQEASASRVNRLLSSSTSLHEYIVGYVRHLGRLERSIWYYVQNVHYRGVAY